jgi:crotonobetainyl-CoA:carnitine CoA-transferase CaiB-like acyl-CoA transferase
VPTTRSAPPLDGLRVLDFTHAAAGPFATMLLADLGADVLKIEKPGRGDGARHMGSPMRGALDSDYYLSLNRTKRSLLLDLGRPEARDLAVRLAGACDIVVQNFRPGVMDRLGLGYEDLRTARQGLIYCSISAFGDDGPWRDRPANDIIMQSVSGLMGITGEVGGGPVRIGAPISDYTTGLFALTGILAALHVRDTYPEGQHVKISMLDSSLAMMANYFPAVATLGKTIPRLGRGHAQIVPYQAFECSDGEYVMVGAFTNGFWRRLCTVLGRPEWADDERFATNASRLDSRDYLLGELEKIFAGRTRAEWTAALDAADVPNSPVLELNDALKSEQAVFNGSVQRIGSGDDVVDTVKCPVSATEWEPRVATMPPSMGEHSAQILNEILGLPEEEIAALVSAGAVGGPDGR